MKINKMQAWANEGANKREIEWSKSRRISSINEIEKRNNEWSNRLRK